MNWPKNFEKAESDYNQQYDPYGDTLTECDECNKEYKYTDFVDCCEAEICSRLICKYCKEEEDGNRSENDGSSQE